MSTKELEQQVALPAIITDMINKMNDASLPRHVRDNYRDSLLKVSDVIITKCHAHMKNTLSFKSAPRK